MNNINVFIDEKIFLIDDFVGNIIDAEKIEAETYKNQLYSLPIVKTVECLSKYDISFEFYQDTIVEHFYCWERFLHEKNDILFCINQDVTVDDNFNLESLLKEFSHYDLVYTSDLSLYIMKQSFCKFIVENNKKIDKLQDLFDECYQENKSFKIKKIGE